MVPDPFTTNEPKKGLDNNGNHNNNNGTNTTEIIDNHQSNKTIISDNKNGTKTANFATFNENTDFFAAFDDNFNKPKTNSAALDPFAFNNNETKHTTTLIKTSNVKNSSKSTKNQLDDAFDNAFGALAINKTKDTGKFGFDDGFDDFGQFDARFATSKTTTGLGTPPNQKKIDKHRGERPKNTSNNAASKNGRYASDYSKTDRFDDDLEAVLQRSLVDQ